MAARIKIYEWEKKGGIWFSVGRGYGLLLLVKPQVFCVGIEFFKTGVCIFVGPFCVGCGTVEDD